MARTTQVNFRLDPALVQAIGPEAERRGISKVEFVRRALRAALETSGADDTRKDTRDDPRPTGAASARGASAPPSEIVQDREAFERRVKELSRVMPAPNARRLAYREGLRP